jgi:hypothetical protein
VLDAYRKVVSVDKGDVIKRLLAVDATSKVELGECCGSITLTDVSCHGGSRGSFTYTVLTVQLTNTVSCFARG